LVGKNDDKWMKRLTKSPIIKGKYRYKIWFLTLGIGNEIIQITIFLLLTNIS
jgi:hypothetical protein